VIVMYRCYLLRNGRIVRGDNLDVETLDKAIADGFRLLAMGERSGPFSGMEIWRGASLLYSNIAYADASGARAPVESPFNTPDSTILPNWRPTLARPVTAPLPAGSPELLPAEADAATVRFAGLRKLIRRKPARRLIAA
jgi:hypothetical protein